MSQTSAAPGDSRTSVHQGGSARLCFERSPDGKSFISEQDVAYPFHVTRPFYLQGDPAGMPTLYLQSVSGGLFRDDVVDLALRANAAASAHVTTQSATIVHSMETGLAKQTLDLVAADRAFLEYLPDPVVLFPKASLSSRLRVTAAESSTVVLCDSFLSHDPEANGGLFDRFSSDLRVERPNGDLLCADRFVLSGSELIVDGKGGDSPFSAHGTLLCLHTARPASDLVHALNEALAGVSELHAGASALPAEAGAWLRMLAVDSNALRTGLCAAWKALRITLCGQEPSVRRK